MVPPVGISELHMDPPTPMPYTGEGAMLGDLDAEAIDRFVAAAGPDSGSTLVSAEIRHLGGALRRARHGARRARDARRRLPRLRPRPRARRGNAPLVRGQIDGIVDALAPYANGRQYLNFTEARTDPARFYSVDVYATLRAVKARVDPDEVFRANHPIAPAA